MVTEQNLNLILDIKTVKVPNVTIWQQLIFSEKKKKISKEGFLLETSLLQPYYIQKHHKIIFLDRFSIFGTERVKMKFASCLKRTEIIEVLN